MQSRQFYRQERSGPPKFVSKRSYARDHEDTFNGFNKQFQQMKISNGTNGFHQKQYPSYNVNRFGPIVHQNNFFDDEDYQNEGEASFLAFEDQIQEIDDRQCEDQTQFINSFQQIMEKFYSLANPIKFKACKQTTPQLILFGEMGNGKSTTGNMLIRILNARESKKTKKSETFEASKSTVAVTKNVQAKKFDGITLIDTPGFSDTDPQRTDTKLFSEIVDSILNKAVRRQFGIAAMLQCVQVPHSGRIASQPIKILSKMLQTLTLSYPDSKLKGPQILILFTFFSRFDLENEGQNLNESYESEDDEDQIKDKEEASNVPENQAESDTVTFENLIKRFKIDLVKQINEDQGFTSDKDMDKTTKIVEHLFPIKNFFSFKLFDDQSKAKKEKEDLERILDLTMEKGNYVITNTRSSHLLPIVMNNDCREQIIHQVQEILQFCESQTIKTIKEFSSFTNGKQNSELNELHDKILEIKKQFETTIIKKPYSIQKASPKAIEQLQQIQKRFSVVCSFISQKELSKFNMKESQNLKKELEKVQKQMRDQQENLNQKLCDQLEMFKEERERAQARRKKNVYNPRFADKRCWGCGQAGHLIYWCPDNY